MVWEGRRELPPTILLRRSLDYAEGPRIRAVATGRRGSVCLVVKRIIFDAFEDRLSGRVVCNVGDDAA